MATPDPAVDGLEQAMRTAISQRAGGGATAAAVGNLPLKCLATAVVNYGQCKLTGGRNCELNLVKDVISCFL